MPTLPTPATAAANAAPPGVLGDIASLLQESRPKPTLRLAGRAILAVWAVAVVGPLLGLNAPALETTAILVTLGGIFYLNTLNRLFRQEMAALDGVESQLALRRTEAAVPVLHQLMSRPMRAHEHRLRAMLLLGGVLSRLGRTDDAIAVYNELIDREGLAGPGGAVVKIARANEMLRADHLYDADRAINDIKRLLERGGVAAQVRDFDPSLPTRSDPAALAGFRLLELYRDVKTGHLTEAVERYQSDLPLLRSGLGHRVAEVHALAAVAYHQLDQTDLAAARFLDATALAPLSELVRKYPELWPLTKLYPMTLPPR